MKVSRTEKSIRQIIDLSFPEYKGRKISIAPQTRPLPVRDFGGGGTWSKWVFIKLDEMRSVEAPSFSPFNPSEKAKAFEGVNLPEGILAVEHAHFCGKDCGLTIHVNPANLVKFLPEGSKPISDAAKEVLRPEIEATQTFIAETDKKLARYHYAPQIRPPTTFTLPRMPWELIERPYDGYDARVDLPRSTHRYGVVGFRTKLDADVVEHFDLLFLEEVFVGGGNGSN